MVTNQLRSLSHSAAELKAPFISIDVLCLMASCGCYIRPARRLRKRVGWTKLNISTFQNHEPSNLTRHQACTEKNTEWLHRRIGHIVFSTKLTTESHPIVSTATPAESQLDIKDIHSCINCCLPFCSHPFPTLTVISFSTASISSSSCSGSFWCIPSDTNWLISPRDGSSAMWDGVGTRLYRMAKHLLPFLTSAETHTKST